MLRSFQTSLNNAKHIVILTGICLFVKRMRPLRKSDIGTECKRAMLQVLVHLRSLEYQLSVELEVCGESTKPQS